YIDPLMLAALSIRPKTFVQEALILLHESTAASLADDSATAYLHRHALAVTFDCAEAAADTCPCDDTGRPRNTRTSHPIKELPPAGDDAPVNVHFRVD
ncbi:hypothetical protein BU15DRAFT_37345, partial [Melanogaster broomeanus]